MKTITGTWKKGKVVLDAPANWPEGCRLQVEPLAEERTLGMREEDWPTTKEGIAEWLKWYDSLEPLEMTAAEIADWQAWRKKIKDYTLANMSKRIDGLFE